MSSDALMISELTNCRKVLWEVLHDLKLLDPRFENSMDTKAVLDAIKSKIERCLHG